MIKAYTTFDIISSTSHLTKKNWNTLQQIVSLRCQVDITKQPYMSADQIYCFEFEPHVPTVYASPEDPLFYLRSDSNSVPMIIADPEEGFRIELIDALSDSPTVWYEII